MSTINALSWFRTGESIRIFAGIILPLLC